MQAAAEAERWYQTAAVEGHSEAMNNLGALYHSGNGVVGSVALAVGWFVRAVLAGNSSAVCNLGLCFEEGTGVAKDWAQAEQLYREAAEAGNTTALCSLGYLYTLQEQYEAVRGGPTSIPSYQYGPWGTDDTRLRFAGGAGVRAGGGAGSRGRPKGLAATPAKWWAGHETTASQGVGSSSLRGAIRGRHAALRLVRDIIRSAGRGQRRAGDGGGGGGGGGGGKQP
jgi:TPR repeat protein